MSLGLNERRSSKYEPRSTRIPRSYVVLHTSYFLATIAVAAVWFLPAAAQSPATIRGFSAAAGAAEAARERELKALPSAKAAEADFDVMTAEPHHTGSPYEIKLADYVTSQFTRIGME